MINMCLCNGTGGIRIAKSSGVGFYPCPDSNCQFDKAKADREFEAFVLRVQQFKNRKAV